MKKYLNPPKKDWPSILERPTQTYQEIESTVESIFKEISQTGDQALKKYTEKFDSVLLEQIEVSKLEFDAASEQVSTSLKNAIAQAKNNIEAFHSAQQVVYKPIETTAGVLCWQEKRAIEKVGLYIPGGTAPLFSTILMLAVPAVLAGCKEIVLCTPCDKNGKIHPAILYTAELCGINKVYKLGGIQAIGAMTFGTETVPKTFKIFGPGNQFVTVAKQMAIKFGVAIDLPAGPSELLVYADETADPGFMAADLLSQAEHGTDSQVILVSTSKSVIERIEKEIGLQIEGLPRKEIAQCAIENSKLICCESEDEAIDLINEYAPEHLIVNVIDATKVLTRIMNAGSVFIGNYTPESAGDYASGTNHTLPTNGFAKNFSGVNLDSFQKTLSFQKISEIGICNIGESIELMAEAEGLFAHKNAVSLRLKSIADNKNKNDG